MAPDTSRTAVYAAFGGRHRKLQLTLGCIGEPHRAVPAPAAGGRDLGDQDLDVGRQVGARGGLEVRGEGPLAWTAAS
jgi:hypothetical protein